MTSPLELTMAQAKPCTGRVSRLEHRVDGIEDRRELSGGGIDWFGSTMDLRTAMYLWWSPASSTRMPVRMAVRAPVKPETNSEKGKQSWKVESAFLCHGGKTSLTSSILDDTTTNNFSTPSIGLMYIFQPCNSLDVNWRHPLAQSIPLPIRGMQPI
jgi:hypothetical protein